MIHPALLPYIALLIGQVGETHTTAHEVSAFIGEPPVEVALTTSVDGDDLLVLINKSKDNRLDSTWAPSDLVSIQPRFMVHGHTGMLRKEAAAALSQMLSAARKRHRRIRVVSAYRSYKTQKRVFRSKVRKYGERKARYLSAKPGHSQHQLGTTIDLSVRRHRWKFSQSQGKSAGGRWLTKNAHLYGFVLSYPRGQRKLTGYIHEPWHFRYIGISAATEMHDVQLPLEAFLVKCRRLPHTLRCDS